jgi:hypothetical protein
MHQHPVSQVSNAKGATFCQARRLLVRYVVTFYVHVTSATFFDLMSSLSRTYLYVTAALYFFLLFHCSKGLLKLVPIIV